jgi:hypothetical protein
LQLTDPDGHSAIPSPLLRYSPTVGSYQVSGLRTRWRWFAMPNSSTATTLGRDLPSPVRSILCLVNRLEGVAAFAVTACGARCLVEEYLVRRWPYLREARPATSRWLRWSQNSAHRKWCYCTHRMHADAKAMAPTTPRWRGPALPRRKPACSGGHQSPGHHNLRYQVNLSP